MINLKNQNLYDSCFIESWIKDKKQMVKLSEHFSVITVDIPCLYALL